MNDKDIKVCKSCGSSNLAVSENKLMTVISNVPERLTLICLDCGELHVVNKSSEENE